MARMVPKIGAIVLATDQGLGYLARDFVEQLEIDRVLVKPHSSRTNHYEWYPEHAQTIEELLDGIDILLAFETFFDWNLIARARANGIKSALMTMYECTPANSKHKPDFYLAPSDLDLQYYPSATRVTVPVSVKWRERQRARVFVHNAGNGGLGGRNGTRELLEAMEFVRSPIRLIVRTQTMDIRSDDPRVEIRKGQATREELYEEGDVFIFPEKFNGLSLPLQEAFASGMLVMASDRFPNNRWLPKQPLIPVAGYVRERIATEFSSATLDPRAIADHIDSWYNANIKSYSQMGRKWGIQNSWKKLRKKYRDLFADLTSA